MTWSTHPAGYSPPLHVHADEGEALWLIEGTLTVRCGERTFTAEPSSYTFLPPGVPHTFLVEGDTPARLLTTAIPSSCERFF